MPRPRILDPKIMSKIAEKTGKTDITAVSNMVSKKAKKLRISSEAALVVLATEYDVGTAIYQRGLNGGKQAEIRYALSTISEPKTRPFNSAKKSNPNKNMMVKRTSSRLPWLILAPNFHGIGLDIKKMKWFQKWSCGKSYKNG